MLDTARCPDLAMSAAIPSCRSAMADGVDHLGLGICGDVYSRTYDSFFIELSSIRRLATLETCSLALKRLGSVEGVVGTHWAPHEPDRQRCQILCEDGVDPRAEVNLPRTWVASMSAFVKEKTVVECASNWLCNESRVEGKGRGAILGLASTNYAHPRSVHCLRLRKPRLQSVRTFSYQVIDGWRLRADQCVPCASMARCMSYCNVHQPCRGFTCSRRHGTCYAAIDYTPQFSTSGVQLDAETTSPLAPVLRRGSARWHFTSFPKWTWPLARERRPGYHQIYFLLHHKARSSMVLQVAMRIAAHFSMSMDLVQLLPNPVLRCARADVGVYFVTTAEVVPFLNHNCQPYRAVHVLRDPVDLLASAYAYHKAMLMERNDTIPRVPCEVLRRLPLLQGLLVEAFAELRFTLHHMSVVHQQSQNDSRILSVHGEELSQDLDGILQRLLKHLFPELPRHRQIMLKFDASMLDARRCGSTTMADTMLQPAGHQFLKEQALQAVRSLRDRKPIVRIHEIRNLLGYLDPLRARGLMRRTCRRAQFSVADSLSGMVFLASGSRAQGLKCFAQHGHYLLFDSGLKSRSNVSAPWFRGVGVPEGLLGICVNFTLVGCEVQAAWSFLLRRFSQPLETPPPPEAIIRARLCSQTAFEAWAVLQEFLGEDCWKTSLPVLAKRLQSMDLFDPALQTALLNAVSLAQSESSVQLGSPKNLIENRSDF